MNPILRLIDWTLREHGAFVSGLFVYVAVPLTAWWLGRRSGRKKLKGNHTFILLIRPLAGQPNPSAIPPIIRWEIELPTDGSGPFDYL
ncbi:MAG TPA: hypothetical protein VH595_16940 [Verrucomicrobiae bacterium]|jgi:hypothetical protein|nr:hypothetical protein [Verrucomicrobiae bacterium]